MANSDHKNGAPTNIHVGPPTKKTNWLLWLLLALGLLALLFGLRRCSQNDAMTRVVPIPATAPATDTAVIPAHATSPVPESGAVPAGMSGVGNYLAGTEALPQTFFFEKLHFDTAKSDIRAADRDEVNMLGAAMKQYPNARIRIVGYADARGGASANATLGKKRAESVKEALVADGIAPERVDTASGGESNPVDSNATSSGQAENRRTELVILER